MDGRVVETAAGEITIETGNIVLERVAATFIERLLSFVADPNVAVILMSLATTGIIIEMWNPGSIFPGRVGRGLFVPPASMLFKCCRSTDLALR